MKGYYTVGNTREGFPLLGVWEKGCQIIEKFLEQKSGSQKIRGGKKVEKSQIEQILSLFI